jgi:hypothetical protein
MSIIKTITRHNKFFIGGEPSFPLPDKSNHLGRWKEFKDQIANEIENLSIPEIQRLTLESYIKVEDEEGKNLDEFDNRPSQKTCLTIDEINLLENTNIVIGSEEHNSLITLYSLLKYKLDNK